MSTIPAPTQYLTDHEGKPVGVVLPYEAYLAWQKDADLLLGLGREELELLAQGMLVPHNQVRLTWLLEQNKVSELSEAEGQELDGLLAQVDQLNLLRARAEYSLQRR